MKSLYSLLCWNQNICKTFYFFLCWSDAVLTMPFLCIEHVLHVDIGQFRFNRGVIIWSSCASSILSINELTEDSGSHTIFAQWETLTQHQHQRQQKKKKSEITYWIWLTWFPLSSLDWATANDEKKTRGIACGKFRYFLFVLLLCLLFEEWTFGSIIIYEIYVKALNAIRMTARWFRFFFFLLFHYFDNHQSAHACSSSSNVKQSIFVSAVFCCCFVHFHRNKMVVDFGNAIATHRELRWHTNDSRPVVPNAHQTENIWHPKKYDHDQHFLEWKEWPFCHLDILQQQNGEQKNMPLKNNEQKIKMGKKNRKYTINHVACYE